MTETYTVEDLWWLSGVLTLLLMLSAFFSGSETAMNSINRYRLAYWSREGKSWAVHTAYLLRRPERILGVILVGNNIVNITAAAWVTLVSAHLWGEAAVVPASLALTLGILIFAEVLPKSLASKHPEQIVRLVIHPLRLARWLISPLAWVVNGLAAVLLRPFERDDEVSDLALDEKELKALLETAGELISAPNLRTMVRILEMTELTVADVMVPHTDIVGLDLEDDIDQIRARLQSTKHALLPVYRRSIDDVIGFLSLRTLTSYLLAGGSIDLAVLENRLLPPLFTPEKASLYMQLAQFREEDAYMALVVDEHGSVQGLLTVRDLLAEIVGELDPEQESNDSKWQLSEDGSIVVDGGELSREINREMGWSLPDHADARTINGLILEELEMIPDGNVCLQVGDYRLETLRLENQAVRLVRVWQYR